MSLQFQHGFERFRLAAEELIDSNDNIKKSLRRAFYHIEPLREHNIPEELRKQFNCIQERILSGIPQNREGILEATVNQITKDQMDKLIEDILKFNQQLIYWERDNLK